MPGHLRLKRNTKANIGTLQEGEPFWCTDENVLYVGDGSANHPAVTIASLSIDADIKTLSVPASTTITTFAQTFLDDTSAAAVRATIEAQVSGSYQASDATLTALAALTLTQGMLLTATGADAPSVLAKGTANLKLFMNAGATAPEWASGFKMGSFTRAIDGSTADVSYTGVGFKPSHVFFFMSGPASCCFGVDDGTSRASIYPYISEITAFGATGTTSLISLEDGSKYQTGIIKTLDSDGFTITWTKNGSPSTSDLYTGWYLAKR
jgi:hypothetical protein